jgi:hypothetical protein
MINDDYHRLRISYAQIANAATRRNNFNPPPHFPAFVGRVTADSASLATTSLFYTVNPVTVLGKEGEGNLGSLSVNTAASILVYMIGPQPPAVGDDVVCRYVKNRWVAERMAKSQSQTVPIPGCLCTATPRTLHMASTNTISNGGMFQNCNISYVQTPPEYSSLFLGNSSFLSAQSFTDTDTGDSFRYLITCASVLYEITRIFVTSVFGSPFKEPPRYTWLMFAPGNTCTPFRLGNGQIFAGGDPTCTVTISG